jgi:type VI secretion system protein ImpL
VLRNNGGDLDRGQRAIASALATFNQEARRQLFEQPVMQAWQAVLAITQRHLNTRWQDVVYTPFRTRFAGSYPFDPSSSADAPLSDVEAFFAPETGAVNVFLSEELEPYVGRDIDRPVLWKGTGIRLSPAAREAIRRAQQIAANLYTAGRMSVSFELQPEQPEATANAPAVDQVSIRLLGREDIYTMGFQSWTRYDWPGAGDALLRVSTQAGELAPRSYDGAWALMRMLQDARITPRTSTQFELRWSFERPGEYTITARYNLRTQSAANPFGNLRGFFNFQPPSALDQ